MTLDEVCTVGNAVLQAFDRFTPSAERHRIEPIVESCSEASGNPLTEEKVRSTVLKVLNRLAALPKGVWTTPPQPMTVGGVELRVVHKGNIAVGFNPTPVL